jgi:hypothetical protein
LEVPVSAAPLTRAVAVALGAIVIQFVVVTAFAWPAARLAPRHLPVAVAGSATPAAAVAREISRGHPGAFRIIPAAGAAQARQDIAGRRAYGAIVVGGPSPLVLTASAASPAVAQLLTQVAGQMAGVRAPVRDVVPTDPGDPHGAAFGAMLLPLVITSILGGALLALAVGSVPGRIAGLAVFSAGGGAAVAATAMGWLSILPGNYAATAAIIGLIVLAVAATVAGLGAVAGRAGRAAAGVGLGAAIMLVLGNPFSGATSAPELLPSPWGQIGQWLPPGAGATLLRAVGYFNGSRAGEPWAVLAAWAGAGLLLLALSAVRRPGSAPPVGSAGSAFPGRAGEVHLVS